jgi:hypothetical protein
MRRNGRWSLVLILPALLGAMLGAAGCDRRAAKTARNVPPPPGDDLPMVDVPAAGEAQPAGATQPQAAPDTQPANAFLTIDAHLPDVAAGVTQFPPARLRLTKTPEGVTALLFSDDPKNATGADYKGNSFYFDLPLQVTDVSDIRRATYAYKSDDSEPSESPNGIFLKGTRYHLQPQDVAIRFDGEGKKVMAQIAGRFLVVRTAGEGASGQVAAVQGTLYTTAEVEE